MANGKPTIKSFDEYKRLSKEEKDFFVYEQLAKIADIYDMFRLLDGKYANKKVERLVYGGVGVVLVAVIGAIVGTVLI